MELWTHGPKLLWHWEVPEHRPQMYPPVSPSPRHLVPIRAAPATRWRWRSCACCVEMSWKKKCINSKRKNVTWNRTRGKEELHKSDVAFDCVDSTERARAEKRLKLFGKLGFSKLFLQLLYIDDQSERGGKCSDAKFYWEHKIIWGSWECEKFQEDT